MIGLSEFVLLYTAFLLFARPFWRPFKLMTLVWERQNWSENELLQTNCELQRNVKGEGMRITCNIVNSYSNAECLPATPILRYLVRDRS